MLVNIIILFSIKVYYLYSFFLKKFSIAFLSFLRGNVKSKNSIIFFLVWVPPSLKLFFRIFPLFLKISSLVSLNLAFSAAFIIPAAIFILA
uniref:Uncharacterized protein n=2 Tax=Clostridium perfringens TaxID=1502 RepID=D2X8P3_CLOPF|nr:conserved hypothetical protein [Clostridium perfringens B]ADA82958.1 conserved hypothetical protein [Clostridium perfringens B]ADO24130.1 hypothetical protein [Clostridium perfringens C]